MDKVHILFLPPSDAGIYSGGSWAAGLPLSNLKTASPSEVARSTDATEASARFVVDMLSRQQISMIAMIAHNMSLAAEVRVRVSNNADGSAPSLDHTIMPESNVVWGALSWGSLPWTGKDPEYKIGGALTICNFPAAVSGRYLLIDISDETNIDGYIQIGRLMAGPAFVPTINFSPGATVKVIDDSTSSRSVGGRLYFDKRPKRRAASYSFPALTEGEAYGAIFDIIWRLGITDPLLVCYAPDDPARIRFRRSVYGTLESLEPIVTANEDFTYPYTWHLSILELL